MNVTFINHSNICMNIHTSFPDIVDKLCIRIIFAFLYGFVFLFGILGNIMTLHCIIWHKLSVGVNSSLIMSLAFADLLLSLTSLPISGIHGLSRIWYFGWFACKATPMFTGGPCFICVFTLAAIAIERYRVMMDDKCTNNLTEMRRNKIGQITLVILLWVLGFLVCLPEAVAMRLDVKDNTFNVCGPFCQADWSQDVFRVSQYISTSKVYGTMVFCAQFLLPLFIILFCYGKLRYKVEQTVSRRMRYRLSERAAESIRRRKQRTLRIIVLMCAAFTVSWMPINLLNMCRDFQLLPLEYHGIVFECAHLAAMSSIFWNPIIYCWLNSDFQNQFFILVRCERDERRNASYMLCSAAVSQPNTQSIFSMCNV